MSWKQIVYALVLVDFLALSGWVVWEVGYLGFYEAVLANSATVLMFTDLVLALTLIAIWMWRDARERGLSVVPYLVITLLLGSAGPLLYLIRRESALRAAPSLAETPASS